MASPCANECGFYGSSENNNLCSYCYRRQSMILKSAVTPADLARNIILPVSVSDVRPLSDHNTSVVVHTQNLSASTGEAKIQTSTSPDLAVLSGKNNRSTRCECCRKKVGLTAIRCRCGQIFCSLHRYPEQHSCSFDFKATAREAIAKANPLVQAPKIAKI